MSVIRIPDRFNLMGVTWRVTKLGVLEDVDPDGTELLYGRCNNARREIRLYTGGDPADVVQTFFHELTHAVCKELGIKWEENEPTTNTFAAVWTDTIVRNGIVSIEED